MNRPFFVKMFSVLFVVLSAVWATGCGYINPMTPASYDALRASAETKTFSVPTRSFDMSRVVTIAGKEWVTPIDIDLVKYPLLGGQLSDRDAMLLGLRKEPLQKDTIFWNELRERRTFEAALIKAGTPVWVSYSSLSGWQEVRYLVSCGNRLEEMTKLVQAPTQVVCPTGVFTLNGMPVQGDQIAERANPAAAASPTTGSSATKLMEKDEADGGFFGGLFGDILKTLIKLVLLLLLLWLIWAIVRGFYDWLNRPDPTYPLDPIYPPTRTTAPTPSPMTPPVFQPEPAPVAPTPQPAKATSASEPVAVAPVTAAKPASVKTTTTMKHRFGPYKRVDVGDRQADGYHVTGDGDEIGVFKSPGRTEDAANDGHYFVVEEVTEN
ncbi:MAG: hypothetical protein KBD55_00425 [Candidatus Pacebacteria bacterium]|jgi:hypothetical protein|nr:hypothetical protein [Candidatus Paceibacterota bacterium]